MRKFSFVKLDVFAARPLEGNQLAVFTDARGLTDAEMQSLAREMNLSETTFILPRSAKVEREQGVKVRIFTVSEELPFAGHPTLGTARVLLGRKKSGVVSLELRVGRVPVIFSEHEGRVFGEMTQRDPEFGSIHDREAFTGALGLRLEDLDDSLPVQTVSTGLIFAIAPLRDLATIQRLSFSWQRAAEYLSKTDAKFIYWVSRQTVDPAARVHARMIFYNGEDPATGSAAGCCASWMAAHGVARPDEQVLIEQGIEMRRPSRLFVRASKQADRVHNVRVGGHAVEIMRGEVALP